MPKFYITFQLNPLTVPVNPEERAKNWLSMLELVKADMRAGLIKDWGWCSDGSCGYTIIEVASEVDLFTALLRWIPYVEFNAKPVMTLDQTIESVKKAVAAMKK